MTASDWELPGMINVVLNSGTSSGLGARISLAAIVTILAKEGRIDVLINNSGIGFARSTKQITLDDGGFIDCVGQAANSLNEFKGPFRLGWTAQVVDF